MCPIKCSHYLILCSPQMKMAGSNALFAALTEISDNVLSGAETNGFNGMVMVKLVYEINNYSLLNPCTVLKTNVFGIFNLKYSIGLIVISYAFN